jgi:hypothetical protein
MSAAAVRAATAKVGRVERVFGRLVVDPEAARWAERVDAGFLAEAGWDAALLTLFPPADHPLLGRPVCRAAGCTTTAPTRERVCFSCRRRLAELGLLFFDPDTRDLLRIRPNPLSPAEVARLRGARPAGPPPQPSTGPVWVQRRASNTGIVMVVGHKIALGRAHKHQTVAIDVTETDLVIHLDGSTRTVARTTDLPVRWIKAHRPRKIELNV